jgi:arginyl-tRNA synthetase
VVALRYFMLKYTRNSVIAFDFQEALSFEGETGPYVQYAAVRAGNTVRKLEERGEALPDFPALLSEAAMERQLTSADLWQLLLAASTFLLWMTVYFRAQLERTLKVLGIEVPEYM